MAITRRASAYTIMKPNIDECIRYVIDFEFAIKALVGFSDKRTQLALHLRTLNFAFF
jgi:hypothetical protein